MAGPWEQYQTQPTAKPWESYQQPPAPVGPWQNYQKPTQQLESGQTVVDTGATQLPTGDQPLKLELQPRPAWTVQGAVTHALEPFTSYPRVYNEKIDESLQQMKEGWNQLTTGEKTKGAFNVGVGALGYGLSPVNAALSTIVGKPLEENLGVPHEYSEFTAGLALPGLGLTKAPKTLQKLVSPETIAPEAMEAAAIIRKGTGRGARDTETTTAVLEPFQKPVSQLSPAEQLGIMHYVEGTGPAPATPQMRALADTLKDVFKQRLDKLQSLPQHAQMQFVEDYFPHFWKNPTLAANTFTGGRGAYKQGSGASLKARTVPTIQEGINQGLEPLTTNPIEATLRYVTSIDKFVAAQEVLNTAKANGTVIYRRPQVVGASGHPESFQIPPGYAPLEGRGAKDTTGAQAYAPENFARVYNNWISRGWEQLGGGEYGDVYNMARRSTNAVTQALLSFSGYHAFTMAEAAMSSQWQKALTELRAGHPLTAAKEAAKSVTAPVSYAREGTRLRDVYLGKNAPVSTQDKDIIDLITDAGGRFKRSQHSLLDYESSALGDYVTSFRRGQLGMQMQQQWQGVKNRPIVGTMSAVTSNIGRVMDTFNKPLFQHYIPAMKNAAAYETLAQWMKLNPAASSAEKLAEARKIVDSIDNRFGEMIHDNIFWNRVAKQTAMLSMLSYSWNMGGIREIGGGLRDIARTAVKGEELSRKADYAIGMTINWAIMSAAYQFMKTGEPPKDIHDLAAPRTGGVDVRTGEPERIIPPGIMKDVFGYSHNFGQEVTNKVNPGLKLAAQTASIFSGMGGQDWRGDPILSPRRPTQSMGDKSADWLAEYFQHVVKAMSPISYKQAGRGPEEGSNLSYLELLLGIRKAPRHMVDPTLEQRLNKAWTNKWKMKLRHDQQEQQRYGGTEE